MPLDFISPVTPETCRPLIGKPVCVVLHDGSRYYGYLQVAETDRLLLAANADGDNERSGPATRTTPLRKNAHFPDPRYGYPGGKLVLPLERVALLFTLPFLLF